MTTQYAVLTALSGQTLTAKLFTDAAPDTEVTGNTITVTERTNAKGQYRAAIVRTPTALSAGDYTLIYFNGSLPAAIGKRTFLGTDGETATETPAVVELDSATAAQLDQMQDGLAWLLTERVGAVANPQNAAALCQLTIWGSDYSVQFADLTETGVRGETTLSKA